MRPVEAGIDARNKIPAGALKRAFNTSCAASKATVERAVDFSNSQIRCSSKWLEESMV